MIRQEIKNLIKKSIKKLYKQEMEVLVEQPENKEYGDYSTNIAMLLKKNPQEIAGAIKSDILERVEVKNGFINFFLSKEYLQNQVGEILKQKESFGKLRIGRGQKVNVEFISANPTGPLTLGNGRGGFCGDVLANILTKAGCKVSREYYVNDRGEQVVKLGHSVIGDSEAVYKGPYIEELKKKIKDDKPAEAGGKAAKMILEKMIKPTVKKMGIKFDVWFSEKSLYQKREIAKVLDFLKKKKLTYEKERALWFKSTRFGDDKDRVLIKEDGEETYFLSDIAYLNNKFKRGFDRLVFFWGADHYGYINRIKAAAQALGYDSKQIEVIIMQLVAIMWVGNEGPKEVARMSKRKGVYRTIDELIDGLSLDIVRFFFLTKSPQSHLIFDLDLAKEQSEKNPVYYVQYAHARICSIMSKYGKSQIPNPKSQTSSKFQIQNSKLKLLNHHSELELTKQLIRFPEIIEDTAKDYQVQRIPQYALDLATVFHQFYRDCRVISDDKNLTQARLGLVLATKTVLKNILSLMGISSPEKM